MKTSEELKKLRNELDKIICRQIAKSSDGSLIIELEILDSMIYKLLNIKKEHND